MTRREAMEVLGAIALPSRLWHAGEPALGQARAAPDVEISLTAAPADVQIHPGARTRVWQFTGRVVRGPAAALQQSPGSYLGPTIRVSRGQRVRIDFVNQLPDPSIVHWHGLDVPQESDGHPRLAIPTGARYRYEFDVLNRAGTYWYHPHPHMQTGPQVYSGLAGLFIVEDDEARGLGLPDGADELLWVIQDRRFDRSNQLVYSPSMMDMETGMLGDEVLVNGAGRSQTQLAARPYRCRVLNGSNARIYKLAWSDGTPMTVIGSDGGLLERPLVRKAVTLAPGQRIDLWLDLSSRPVGTRLELRSLAFNLADAGLDMSAMGRGAGRGRMGGAAGMAAATGGSLPLGAPVSLVDLMVSRRDARRAPLPERLSSFDDAWQPRTGAPVRRVPLTFQAMQWFIDGRTFEMDGVADAETVSAGSTHVWEFVNAGGPMGMQMAHPIHLHGRQFRVLGRTGGSPANTLREGLVDEGWMDTVLVLPGESVRVQVRFSRFPGLYLYHCHILEHEDMGMMRNLRIT